MGGGGSSGQISAHVHTNAAGQGGNLTDATLLLMDSVIHPLEQTIPIGSIYLWGGTRATITDWALECDGAAVSRTTFAELFAVVGTQFGIGDGSTTFNLPDLDSKFGRGAPTATDSGATGGADDVTLTGPESGIAAHSHLGHVFSGGKESNLGSFQMGAAASGLASSVAGPTSAASSHENKPAFQEAIYVIRF